MWIINCLPEVPPNVVNDDSGEHTFWFRSTFVGTHLMVKLSNQHINFASDNLSVVTIIKDSLT